MIVSERRNTNQHCKTMSGIDSPDSCPHEVKPRRSSLVRGPENTTPEHVLIEPEYYMNNYEATVTVHKSPPLARRATFDFIEIDDETRDTPPLGSQWRKQKKNLKVTFSDQIEIDIISLINESDSDNDQVQEIDVLDSWTDSETSPRGSFSETSSAKSNISPELKSNQADRSPGRRARTNVVPSRRVETHTDLPVNGKYSQTGRPVSESRTTRVNSGSDSKSARTNTPNESKSHSRISCESKSTPRNLANTSQPLLQRRKQVPKPIVSDIVHQKIVALNNNSSKASGRRFSQSVFPDIVSTLKSEEKYKQFMSGVKRAVDNTRSYERPWLMSNTSTASYQQTTRRHKPEYVDVRRTTSLPKNFKLPENLAHARFGSHIPGSPRSVRN